ncbi:hypothetical protein MCOR02_005319 [Pyricularia oryzae]|nr:hypothetical protein MCOR02_005319 [Pyricularia oryzae]KAI6261528.1 hypothetical protein MCOR19_002223 [Pyricularia oryzae]KAI6264787.1 hypothetical protein MCOR34_011875 [Pyricularia oryzae]KAI6416998.1 hypothetical protein MCOR20_000677 [Pyricularia oryzae]KAI6441771.1 hypothetical protein MCOR17_011698 [Pyricularia oryzae]
MRFTSAVIVALLASGAIAGGKGVAEASGIQHGERVTLANLLAKEKAACSQAACPPAANCDRSKCPDKRDLDEADCPPDSPGGKRYREAVARRAKSKTLSRRDPASRDDRAESAVFTAFIACFCCCGMWEMFASCFEQ